MSTKIYTIVALIATVIAGITTAEAQKSGPLTDTIYTGAGYVNEIYYDMNNGSQGAVNRKQWDIAFRASRMSASILTNDAANNNSLGVNGVELYTYPKSDTSGWASLDTTGLSGWKIMYNSHTDWETGAFCVNQSGHPDYGWGRYNTSSHDVVGDSLYVIKLRDASYRKLWIKRKYSSANTIEFRYAKLDGTADTTLMLDCNPYASKNFVGFSIVTSQVVDFEPVESNKWDILFTKYYYTYPDGTPYPVTGVLSNYGVKVNKFTPVAPDFTNFDTESMDSTRSAIGWDWKYLDSQFLYHVVDSLVYFVQDKGGNIHKLVFKDFAGSSTGRIVLEKELISASSVNENRAHEINAALYPNPADINTVLLINPGDAEKVTLTIVALNGKVFSSLGYNLPLNTLSSINVPVSDLPEGLYIVIINAGSKQTTKKLVVKHL